jgi:fatty-acyl-CoA synthase
MSKRDIHVAAPSLRMALIEAERTARGSGGRETALRDWVRALEATAPIPVQRQRTLHSVIAELAETQGGAPALLSAGESLTYAQLAARANRFARWALTQNLAKGEVACLMMPNRPEYLAIWLGLTSVGVVVALVNTNLRGVSLAHCIDLVEPAHVIVSPRN